jgi:hypothetical protein
LGLTGWSRGAESLNLPWLLIAALHYGRSLAAAVGSRRGDQKRAVGQPAESDRRFSKFRQPGASNMLLGGMGDDSRERLKEVSRTQ